MTQSEKIPVQPAAQPTVQVIPGKRCKPFNPLAFVLRRGPALVLCGALLFAGLALLLLPFARPVYETDATLLIDAGKEPTLNGRERDPIPGDIGDWTRTQIARITSPAVLQAALATLAPGDRPDFVREPLEHPANPFRLMSRIKVREEPRTYLVGLRIRGDSPTGLAPALNAVMDVFLARLQHEFEQTYARRLAYLVEERQKIIERLSVEEKHILELAGESGNTAFLHESYNVHLSKVEQLQRLYWEAFAYQGKMTAEHRKVSEDRMNVIRLDLKAFADERVADNFGINRIEQWTYEQLQQMRATIDGLTENNPDRIYVEARMKAMNDYLAQYKQRVNDETMLNLMEKLEYEQTVKELLARSAADAATRATQILESRLNEAREEADRISMAIFSASSPVFARNQLRDRLQSLNNRIDDTEMEAKTPVRVQIDKRAEPPVEPAQSSRMKLLMLALAAGMGGCAVVFLLLELLDNRVRTAGEVEAAIGGHIPDPVPAYHACGADAPAFAGLCLATGNRDDECARDAATAIADLAARIADDRRRHGTGLCCLFGLRRHSGVTALSLNLATCLDRSCGPVLLVELNARHPGLRCMLELGSAKGMESWLRGECRFEDVLHHDSERNLDVIVADHSGLPSTLSHLPAMLGKLRGNYAMILVDGGVFPSDIAMLAAGCSDAVLLVARARQTLYRELRDGVERIHRMQVPAITAVLNSAEDSRQTAIQAALENMIFAISRIADRLRQKIRLALGGTA